MKGKKLGKQSQHVRVLSTRKGKRPSVHVRRVPTKRGVKRKIINPNIMKKKNVVCVDLYGLADSKKVGVNDVLIDQLKKGVRVEMEHTRDPLVAKKIALDHLAEIPDYYDRLESMEKDAELYWENKTKKVVRKKERSIDLVKLGELERLQKKTEDVIRDLNEEVLSADAMIDLFGPGQVKDILEEDKKKNVDLIRSASKVNKIISDTRLESIKNK